MAQLRRLLVSTTPTITASSAYTSGDVVGGLLTFTPSFNNLPGTGEVRQAIISDNDKQGKPMTLYLFQNSAGLTDFADKTNFAPTASDLRLCIGIIPINNQVAFSVTGFTYAQNFAVPVQSADTLGLFGYLVVSGTPTYTTTSSLTIQLSVIQDAQ